LPEPAPPARILATLDRARQLNELLTFAPHGPDTPWAATDFADAVPDLVDGVGRWLRIDPSERRVAASLVVLGYAARLVGPPVAVFLRDGLLVETRPAAVRFGFAAGRGFRLALAAPAGWTGDPDALVARWRRDTLDDHLAGVIAAVRRDTQVAAALLWGNVASGLLGALATLVRAAAVAPERCLSFATAALADGPLAGTGSVRLTDGRLAFRRRSCCLYYRLPGGGYCGDCCFTTEG
jgi:ferric iron reductase protein FhuF